MRILNSSTISGDIKVQIEVDEDLWHLYNIIDVGDLVTASTTRREQKSIDKIRADRPEKKRMILSIRIEKLDLYENDMKLKLLGIIEAGPQDIGQHHTFMLDSGDTLSINKPKWRSTQINRLERQVQDSKKPKIIFVSLDQDEATIAVLRQYGLKEIATIYSRRPGKQYIDKSQIETYHDNIISKLKSEIIRNMPIVLLGPGFEKEALLKSIKNIDDNRFRDIYVYHTGQSGMVGINELMKTGMGADILRKSSVGYELESVENLMIEISKDGLGVYGQTEVMNAIISGAVEKLLILDTKIREKNLDDIIRMVESKKGSVIIVSSQHDGGKELASLGGIGALLRYKI